MRCDEDHADDGSGIPGEINLVIDADHLNCHCHVCNAEMGRVQATLLGDLLHFLRAAFPPSCSEKALPCEGRAFPDLTVTTYFFIPPEEPVVV